MEGLEEGAAGPLGQVGRRPAGAEELQQGPRAQGQLPPWRAGEDDGVDKGPRGGPTRSGRNGQPGRSGSQRERHRIGHPAN
eukprot:15447654-Alexandrium_andersonii.AAC.1